MIKAHNRDIEELLRDADFSNSTHKEALHKRLFGEGTDPCPAYKCDARNDCLRFQRLSSQHPYGIFPVLGLAEYLVLDAYYGICAYKQGIIRLSELFPGCQGLGP